MFACCVEEPPVDAKAETMIDTAVIAASSEVPPAAPEPVEEPPKVEPQEKAPEPEPVAVVEAPATAVNPMLSVDRTEGAALGVQLDKTDPKNLVLLKISDGLLKATAEASKQDIKAGFRVVKVNGTSGTAADMVTMIQEKKPLEIEFEPFQEKKIKVEKGDKKLGIVLGIGKDGTWIIINKIEADGAIADWNAAAAPEQKVMVSDKIVAVDGQGAKADEMVKWIQDKSSMELTVWSWKSLQA
eukprot:TRINITY_DN8333_c0_g2_i4.p1 TRINITY_DN8333_c0_g2~~TRINITY_DN8333_c0_g2_i4.p1  ORF type:complete len:242 (+),score=62.62 TRINITY_DN8333_c0_g2_i4:62-787(+)